MQSHNVCGVSGNKYLKIALCLTFGKTESDSERALTALRKLLVVNNFCTPRQVVLERGITPLNAMRTTRPDIHCAPCRCMLESC